MFCNSVGHGILLPVVQSVLSPHDALQGRKLPDHPAGKIRFAESGSPQADVGDSSISESISKLGHQCHQTLHFQVEGAELLMKGDASQLLDPVLQRDLSIFIVEELGIRQTGREHPLVARPNDVRLLGAHIRDGDKVR